MRTPKKPNTGHRISNKNPTQSLRVAKQKHPFERFIWVCPKNTPIHFHYLRKAQDLHNPHSLTSAASTRAQNHQVDPTAAEFEIANPEIQPTTQMGKPEIKENHWKGKLIQTHLVEVPASDHCLEHRRLDGLPQPKRATHLLPALRRAASVT